MWALTGMNTTVSRHFCGTSTAVILTVPCRCPPGKHKPPSYCGRLSHKKITWAPRQQRHSTSSRRRYYGGCRIATCAAAAPSIASQQDASGRGGGWKLGLWTALDVTATLGSVGGAVAFILTQEALLVGLPIVLPLLALYASRQREAAALEVRSPIFPPASAPALGNNGPPTAMRILHPSAPTPLPCDSGASVREHL